MSPFAPRVLLRFVWLLFASTVLLLLFVLGGAADGHGEAKSGWATYLFSLGAAAGLLAAIALAVLLSSSSSTGIALGLVAALNAFAIFSALALRRIARELAT